MGSSGVPSEAEMARMYQEAIANLDFDPAALINQLGSLVTDLACDETCKRDQVLAALKKTMDDARRTLTDAPKNLEKAERDYYVFLDGDAQKYTQRMLLRYTAEADAEGRKLRADWDKFFAEYDQWIKMLASNRANANLKLQRLTDLALQYVQLAQTKRNLENSANVSGRKVLYQDKAIDKAQRLRVVLLVAYFMVLVGYLIFGNFFPNKVYLSKGFWLLFVVYVALPFVLNWLVRWGFVLSQNIRYMLENLDQKDVYLKL